MRRKQKTATAVCRYEGKLETEIKKQLVGLKYAV